MHFAEGANPESDFTSCILSYPCNVVFGLIPWAESIWQYSDNPHVIFYVHQYSYDKELYVDWGLTFVFNVKHRLWGTRLSTISVWLTESVSGSDGSNR